MHQWRRVNKKCRSAIILKEITQWHPPLRTFQQRTCTSDQLLVNHHKVLLNRPFRQTRRGQLCSPMNPHKSIRLSQHQQSCGTIRTSQLEVYIHTYLIFRKLYGPNTNKLLSWEQKPKCQEEMPKLSQWKACIEATRELHHPISLDFHVESEPRISLILTHYRWTT